MGALRNRRGQFIPMIIVFVLSFILLLMVVSDVYKVTRAKLQAQNIADAAALAVAALQAKNINVVLDRNEWLNHLYPDSALNPDGTVKDKHQFPGISEAANRSQTSPVSFPRDKATTYAQLIAPVNQAQGMFSAAYNQFLGASPGTAGQGPGSLADILYEIDGLNDPNSPARLIVFNNTAGQSAADAGAKQVGQLTQDQFATMPPITSPGMAAVPFTTEDVKLANSDDNNKPVTLTELYYGKNPPVGPDGNPMKIGWLRPKWDDKDSTLQVNVKQGDTKTTIGAGVIVIKMVLLPGPILKQVFVQAKSVAYVVQESGQDIDPTSPDPTKPRPPSHFRPTYYVQLGYR